MVGVWIATEGTSFSHGSVLVYEPEGGVYNEQARLVAPDGERTPWFGQSVAIDGDTLVVGRRRTAKDRFVQAVVLHGDTLLVGVHAADINGEHGREATYARPR